MSALFATVEGVLVFVAAAATIVSIAGIAFSQDAFARLIYGSIASGGALIALVAAVAVAQGASIVTLQGVVLVLLMIPSSAIAAHRIATLVLDRTDGAPDPADQAAP